MKGLVAFARAAAMESLGACGAALHQADPTSLPMGFWQLDRNEELMHPGEGSADT